MLTTAQLASFERDGYVIVHGYFPAERMARAGAAIAALAARPPRTGHEMVYFEDSVTEPGQRVLSRIEKFVEEDADLGELVLRSGLAEQAAQLLQAPAVLFKEKINFKLPGGQGFAPHQDIQPGWDDYAPYFISVLVTIDPSTVENGCPQLAGVDFVKFPTAPGDVVFFDCFVPHQSAPNRTAQPRRNLYLTYSRADEGDHRAKYFADNRRAFPPDHERE